MESVVHTMDTASYMEKILPLLSPDSEPVPLPVQGHSMSPFLRHKRDTVYLAPLTADPVRGDIVLYRRAGGQYVLHRIYRRENGTYTMIGDGQTHREPGIRREQIVAVVRSVLRGGQLLTPDCLRWKLYSVLWNRSLPLRPLFVSLYRLLIKPFRRKT